MKITKSRLRQIIREAVQRESSGQVHNPGLGSLKWPAGSKLGVFSHRRFAKLLQKKGNNTIQAMLKLHQMATSPKAWKIISSDKAIMRGVNSLVRTASEFLDDVEGRGNWRKGLGGDEVEGSGYDSGYPSSNLLGTPVKDKDGLLDLFEDKLRAVVAAMEKLLKTNSEKP